MHMACIVCVDVSYGRGCMSRQSLAAAHASYTRGRRGGGSGERARELVTVECGRQHVALHYCGAASDMHPRLESAASKSHDDNENKQLLRSHHYDS